MGATVHRLTEVTDVEAACAQLDDWHSANPLHWMLVASPWDRAASSDDESIATMLDSWQSERRHVFDGVFAACQWWMTRMIDDGAMDRAGLAAVVRGGGRFGLVAKPIDGSDEVTDPERLISRESGAISGLVKAMMIEAWMRGFSRTPMKVVDVEPGTAPEEAAEEIWREVSTPSFEQEVVVGTQRKVVRANFAPLQAIDRVLGDPPRRDDLEADRGGRGLSLGDVWVVSGGARGVTARVALEMGRRFGVRLALLGTAPTPVFDSSTREQIRTDLAAVRDRVTREAQSRGENSVAAWRAMEKAIEIDRTLAAMRDDGIDAVYYQTDVADADATATTIQRVRELWGPIRGIVHGAGIGQDARFDRKRPNKIRQCLAAKVDGVLSLAAATAEDPLAWLIGFGSISGRFGANGHTDYSAGQ